MKSIVSLLLIISLAGIATFGLTLFEMAPNHQGNCFAAMDGAACPVNVIANSIHHIAVLQTLTTANTSPLFGTLALLVAFLAVSVLLTLLFDRKWLHPRFELLSQRLRDFKLNYSDSRQAIVSWLSLFELSPAL